MGQEVKHVTRICQKPLGPTSRAYEHHKPWKAYTTMGVVTVLFISTFSTQVIFPYSLPETTDRFDILLMEVDQDGNLVKNATYDLNLRFGLGSVPFWGKTTELTTGGFAIAGYHEIDNADSGPADRQLWVIRTDDDYNPVWNRTYGKTWEVRSITEMNNGDIAIAHYIEDYGNERSTFQILVINDEGEYVKEQSWSFGFGWLSGFSHCDDGGFIIAKEIYNTPNASPFWMARINTGLRVVWNKTFPSFATHSDIVEDMAGGFTMPLEPGLDGPIGIVRLDNQGDESSRVFTKSNRTSKYLTLTQCGNGEYLAGGPGYILRFNIEGNILWEMDVDFYVHGIQELSPDRFVAFEAAGVRVNSWHNPGVYLECFDAGGTTIWIRSVQANGLFVPDILFNTDGCLTILGMVQPKHLPSVLDEINSETPYDFDAWLLDVDQDGNLVKNATYDLNLRFGLGSVPFWGKTTELTTGGFAIAGYHEIDNADSGPADRQLWVIRTDDDYNPVWNRTYGKTWEVRSITEMNNGDIAIGHYVEGYEDYGGIGPFQILVIDDEGEFVRERSWRFGWCSGFSHCDDGGFIIAKEIYNTPNASPFWMARIDTGLRVVWNKTYPSFASGTDIVEDMAGGFTMPLEAGLDGPIGIVRLDDQGDETSRVFTNSTAVSVRLWLTQCSNGEYLGWSGNYIIRFNIKGEILWEKYVDFYVHGIKKLSSNRFVAFESAGVRALEWRNSGMVLECFGSDGTTIWNCSIQAAGFFVLDIISNTSGGLTILGMVASNYQSSVLDGFSETDTDAADSLAASQFLYSLLCSDTRFSRSTRVQRIESEKLVMD